MSLMMQCHQLAKNTGLMGFAAEVHQVQKLRAYPTAESFRVLHGSFEPYFIILYIQQLWYICCWLK